MPLIFFKATPKHKQIPHKVKWKHEAHTKTALKKTNHKSKTKTPQNFFLHFRENILLVAEYFWASSIIMQLQQQITTPV